MKWETSKKNYEGYSGGIDQAWVKDKRQHIENMKVSSDYFQKEEESEEVRVMKEILNSAPKEVDPEILEQYEREIEQRATQMVEQMANNEIDVNGNKIDENEGEYQKFLKDILGFANIPILFTISMIATVIMLIIGFIIIK